MTKIRLAGMLAVVGGVLVASSPAFAWTCTAKNNVGRTFTTVGLVKATTEARVLTRCKIQSNAPGSCVVHCTSP